MVELRKDVEFTGPVVTGFTAQGYKIGDQRFEQGLLISPEQVLDWSGSSLDQMNLGEILSRLNLSPVPEFLLLGSGASMQQPPAAFRREVEAAGMGLEVMDSRAAARTWGVLRAEERWIVGAFLPIA
ncbi:MTH938/NDUFAF3 family protein [Parasphingorhabdus flavimaris]|uniref:MTH938/NDUFAF3 family protein n=1 Tax=Parasphingorhabdus flavimaris TaxID=266812 RepID=UPI001FE51BF4|nr:MTH938/NDUFAF3 family protein [Parasphingorhabdus flavimaris]